jgi:hypothetical protein
MVQTTEERLRQERANLWRAKNLHRQLIGDESWMPCGAVESLDDWDLFEPRPKSTHFHTKKRKHDSGVGTIQNGIPENEDVQMIDQDKTVSQIIEPPEPEAADTKNVENTKAEAVTNGEDETEKDAQVDQADAQPLRDDEESSNPSARSTPPPPRRITRALAAETNPQSNAASPPDSPSRTISTIASDLLEPDPLFLLPPHAHRSHPSIPLPIEELLETRRLLTMYIQKQEETLRSTEAVLGKLIKAKRMRNQVFAWSKAEGHVGEWSDGEDWIDAEYWGEREEDLTKGKDEEDVAGQHAEEDAGGVGIQGGGRKKRRRRERE